MISSTNDMGVLTGKDIFNSKWITAEITDASNRIWYIPIKNPVGDYFLTDIEGQIYCFKIEGNREKTYRHTLVKSFRVLQYDINHYMPISAKDNTELENILRTNNLPKLNPMLFGILKALGKQEKGKGEFTPHQLKDLVEEINKKKGEEYREQVTNIVNYLDHLKVEQIVTPVKKITEFLEEDLIATDPKFLGTVVSTFQRTDVEHKKVTNTPITGKIAWAKIIAIMAIVGLVGALIYLAWDSGMFSGGLPQLPGFETGKTIEEWTAVYTPEELRAAVDSGKVDYDELPRELQKIIDSVELPKVVPKE